MLLLVPAWQLRNDFKLRLYFAIKPKCQNEKKKKKKKKKKNRQFRALIIKVRTLFDFRINAVNHSKNNEIDSQKSLLLH